MSWVTLKSLRMRRIISGRPKIVVRDGQIEQATMRDLRLSVDDLMTALRQQQVFDISQVQFAVMETTGTISVYLKCTAPVSAEWQLPDVPDSYRVPPFLWNNGTGALGIAEHQEHLFFRQAVLRQFLFQPRLIFPQHGKGLVHDAAVLYHGNRRWGSCRS